MNTEKQLQAFQAFMGEPETRKLFQDHPFLDSMNRNDQVALMDFFTSVVTHNHFIAQHGSQYGSIEKWWKLPLPKDRWAFAFDDGDGREVWFFSIRNYFRAWAEGRKSVLPEMQNQEKEWRENYQLKG